MHYFTFLGLLAAIMIAASIYGHYDKPEPTLCAIEVNKQLDVWASRGYRIDDPMLDNYQPPESCK